MEQRIIDILDNVRHWDTCPDDYKRDIEKFLSEVAPKQEQEELDFYCFDKNYHMIEKCKYQCAECKQRAKKFTPPIS